MVTVVAPKEVLLEATFDLCCHAARTFWGGFSINLLNAFLLFSNVYAIG
jgi:hypothetical protein